MNYLILLFIRKQLVVFALSLFTTQYLLMLLCRIILNSRKMAGKSTVHIVLRTISPPPEQSYLFPQVNQVGLNPGGVSNDYLVACKQTSCPVRRADRPSRAGRNALYLFMFSLRRSFKYRQSLELSDTVLSSFCLMSSRLSCHYAYSFALRVSSNSPP
jgi:hypothetical protein